MKEYRWRQPLEKERSKKRWLTAVPQEGFNLRNTLEHEKAINFVSVPQKKLEHAHQKGDSWIVFERFINSTDLYSLTKEDIFNFYDCYESNKLFIP